MKEPTIVANMSGSAKRVLFMGSWGGSMMRPCLVHLSQHVLKGIPLWEKAQQYQHWLETSWNILKLSTPPETRTFPKMGQKVQWNSMKHMCNSLQFHEAGWSRKLPNSPVLQPTQLLSFCSSVSLDVYSSTKLPGSCPLRSTTRTNDMESSVHHSHSTDWQVAYIDIHPSFIPSHSNLKCEEFIHWGKRGP